MVIECDLTTLCNYVLRKGDLFVYKIGYHIHPDNTPLYIPFKCKQRVESTYKISRYLSDTRRWMITNK